MEKLWNEATPPDTGESASLGATRIRELKYAVRERLAVDHIALEDETGEANVGAHKKATFVNQTVDPTAVAGTAILYAKGGEMYARFADGTIVQLTSAGKWIAGALTVTDVAEGDLIYYDGTEFVRLPKGTDGQYLQINISSGGEVTFSWADIVIPASAVEQVVMSQDQVVRSLSTPNMAGGNPPQNTSGGAYSQLDTTITPKKATNILIIEVEVQSEVESNFGSGNHAFLFVDGNANALAGCANHEWYGCGTSGSTTAGRKLVFRHQMVAGTTSPLTFRVRLGCTYGGGLINREPYETNGFGGKLTSSMKITELGA